MIEGRFKKYSWTDIMNLIYADCGLTTDVERRQKGEIWLDGGLQQPLDVDDFCLRVQFTDRPGMDLLMEHMGEEQ